MTKPQIDCQAFLDLLTRWQAFSELQQRAFAFLATEAMAAGQEFENSTEGAAQVMMKLGGAAGADDLRSETFAVVHRLQAADRSRQGLEQVASVLHTLKRQHAELLDATLPGAAPAEMEAMVESWIGDLAGGISLADWRRRLVDALMGHEPTAAAPQADEDDELF